MDRAYGLRFQYQQWPQARRGGLGYYPLSGVAEGLKVASVTAQNATTLRFTLPVGRGVFDGVPFEVANAISNIDVTVPSFASSVAREQYVWLNPTRLIPAVTASPTAGQNGAVANGDKHILVDEIDDYQLVKGYKRLTGVIAGSAANNTTICTVTVASASLLDGIANGDTIVVTAGTGLTAIAVGTSYKVAAKSGATFKLTTTADAEIPTGAATTLSFSKFPLTFVDFDPVVEPIGYSHNNLPMNSIIATVTSANVSATPEKVVYHKTKYPPYIQQPANAYLRASAAIPLLRVNVASSAVVAGSLRTYGNDEYINQ